MKIVLAALFVAASGITPLLPPTSDQPRTGSGDQRFEAASNPQDGREAILTALRRRAKVRIDAEASVFNAAELAAIENRYASAFRPEVPGRTFLRHPEAEPILVDLVRLYPRANRAGCALLLLAQLATGSRRERYLREAIDFDGDAWFENGVQVGALARAMLAIHLAGLERFDEAEDVAAELVRRFPGAIDQSGASLDDTLTAVRQLRPPGRSRGEAAGSHAAAADERRRRLRLIRK